MNVSIIKTSDKVNPYAVKNGTIRSQHPTRQAAEFATIHEQSPNVACLIERGSQSNPHLRSRYVKGARLYLRGAVDSEAAVWRNAKRGTVASDNRPVFYTVWEIMRHDKVAGEPEHSRQRFACDCADFKHNNARTHNGQQICKHIIAFSLFRNFGPVALADTWEADEAHEAAVALAERDGEAQSAPPRSRMAQILRERVGNVPASAQEQAVRAASQSTDERGPRGRTTPADWTDEESRRLGFGDAADRRRAFAFGARRRQVEQAIEVQLWAAEKAYHRAKGAES